MKYSSFSSKSSWLLLLVIGSIFLACNKKLKETVTENSDLSKYALIHELNHDLSDDARSMVVKGTVKVDKWPRAKMELRVIPDTTIWFSIRFIGLEISRGMFTTDSVFVVDHWNKEYWKGKYEDFKDFTKVELDYDAVRDIIFNRSVPRQFVISEVDERAESYSIIAQKGAMTVNSEVDRDTWRLNKSKFRSSETPEVLITQSDDYRSYDKDIVFPYIRDYIILKDNIKEAHVEVRTQDIKTNISFSMPFRVPDRYTVVN